MSAVFTACQATQKTADAAQIKMYLAQQPIRCVKVFCNSALQGWCIALQTADNEPFQQLEVEILRSQNYAVPSGLENKKGMVGRVQWKKTQTSV